MKKGYQPRRNNAKYIRIATYLDDDLGEWFYAEAKRLNISKSCFLARTIRLYKEAQQMYEERKKQNEITQISTVELHQC